MFKIKTEDGKFVKCKARYVFGGHRSVAGIDFVDTLAQMAALKSVRTVLALAAPAGHYLRNFDISQAFTFSKCDRDRGNRALERSARNKTKYDVYVWGLGGAVFDVVLAR